MGNTVTLDWPHEGVALVTVTDAAIPNHNITFATVGMLADALAKAREQGARVSVLASGVPGVWLNHAHLGDLGNLFQGKPASAEPSGWFRAPKELAETDVVTIAAISGNTSGGGCELGWACDLRIAETGVLFSQPEVIIGVGTGIGGTSRLRRLIGRTATAEMVLSGQPASAERIYALGGINRIVPKGNAVRAALDMAAHMATLPAHALAGMKRMLREGEDMPLSAALDNDQKISQALFRDPWSIENMAKLQARYDAGETVEGALFSKR